MIARRVRALVPTWAKRLWWPLYGRAVRAYRGAARREALLPGFLIIGVMKGGTSALFYYLRDHPQVRLAIHKEPHFFDLFYERGLDWYKTGFPAYAPGLISGEGSPYYVFHPLAPGRIHDTLPDASLILLLRDPIRRAYSHYQHMLRRGEETLSFEDAVDAEPERLAGEAETIKADPAYFSPDHIYHSYLSRGRYAEQIETWWQVFPREQMLILGSEEFFADPPAAFAATLTFLGLAPAPLRASPQMNRGSYPPMNPATHSRLRAYFKPHNQRLYDLLGKDFGWE